MKFLRNRRRGVTLVEVLMASVILAGVMAAVMALWISMLRQERSNIRLLRMSYEAASLQRSLREVASVGANLAVTNDNTAVAFDNVATGARAVLRFENDDGELATIGDNRIVLQLDVDDTSSERLIIQNVSPVLLDGVDPNDASLDWEDTANYRPIFQFAPLTRGETLQVQFRIGDRNRPANRRTNDEARADDAFTGPGFQSLVFDGIYSPRNMAL